MSLVFLFHCLIKCKKTTNAEDRHLMALYLRNRFQSASETARHWQGNAQISRQTVVRRLADHGLKCRRPVQKQGLLPRHVAARLAWATHHRRWTIRQWSNFIWSDEKCFVVDKKDGRIRCYRRRNERFRQPNIHQYGPKQTIMIWAAFSADGKSNIIRFNCNVTARRYQDEALLPFLNRHNQQQVLFMQDNATPHRAHTTRAFLQANNVNVFGTWPGKSPDMNPIENLWSQMETAIQRRPNRPTNRDELWQAVQDEWANTNMFDVRRLVFSMRRRCSALVAAAGHHTTY